MLIILEVKQFFREGNFMYGGGEIIVNICNYTIIITNNADMVKIKNED